MMAVWQTPLLQSEEGGGGFNISTSKQQVISMEKRARKLHWCERKYKLKYFLAYIVTYHRNKKQGVLF